MRVELSPPISTAGMSVGDRDVLADRVRDVIATQIRNRV
jgi:hypothetical protein